MNEKQTGLVFSGTVEELKEALNQANELLKSKSERKETKVNNKDLNKLKKLFYQWKEKVDKIVKDNNIDNLDAEHEYYDHLACLYNWVKDGNKYEDMFGCYEDYENCDHLLISYDMVNDIIDAINNCYYAFYKDEDGKFMFIDRKTSWYLQEANNIYKVEMM